MATAPKAWLGMALWLLASIAGSIAFFSGDTLDITETRKGVLSYEELTGSAFMPLPQDPFRAPSVRELPLPPMPNAKSIWGALGRDSRGHIWAGVTASTRGGGARLLEYDPAADSWHDHGSVVDRLREAGLHRDGEGQVLLHSKIVPAADGWLYFATSDEEGEKDDGSALPRWGGHLWRIHPERRTWEHLASVREGLIAVSGVGRYIYALGYWGHVLYQYDTQTRALKQVTVGSVGGHVSRNFLADVKGHAYVPRVARAPDGALTAELIEYDTALKPIASTPLDFYLHYKGRPDDNHGITGLAYLPDGRMLFSTFRGHLYQIEPRNGGSATVKAVGWLHPNGEGHVASLFAFGGSTWVTGVVPRGEAHDWIVYERQSGLSFAFPLKTDEFKGLGVWGAARDNAGRAYVGGWASNGKGGRRPVVLQLDPGG